MQQLRANRQLSRELFGRKHIEWSAIRGEVASTSRAKAEGGTGVPSGTVMARMAMPEGSAFAELRLSAKKMDVFHRDIDEKK